MARSAAAVPVCDLPAWYVERQQLLATLKAEQPLSAGLASKIIRAEQDAVASAGEQDPWSLEDGLGRPPNWRSEVRRLDRNQYLALIGPSYPNRAGALALWRRLKRYAARSYLRDKRAGGQPRDPESAEVYRIVDACYANIPTFDHFQKLLRGK